MHVSTPLVCLCLQRMTADIGTPRTGVTTDDCKLPRGCQELNPSPLEKQSVLRNAELALQSLKVNVSFALEFAYTDGVGAK